MPLITVNVPEPLFRSFLGLMERLVVAVERIAGPEIAYRPPTPATLQDYAYVTPETAAQVQQAQEEFAAAHMLVPGSPAYLAAIAQFEQDVVAAYGEEALDKLPWRVPSGNFPTPNP